MLDLVDSATLPILRKARWWSSLMSQLSVTRVPPSTGSSSYRQIRPPTKPPRNPESRVCQAIFRFSSNSMTVLAIE